jgi:hypothetical protein
LRRYRSWITELLAQGDAVLVEARNAEATLGLPITPHDRIGGHPHATVRTFHIHHAKLRMGRD